MLRALLAPGPLCAVRVAPVTTVALIATTTAISTAALVTTKEVAWVELTTTHGVET